jgi:hypothetical protein
VLLLLAGSRHSGLGISNLGLIGLQGGGLGDGLNGCGNSNLGLLEGLGGFLNSFRLLGGSRGDEIGLLLLVGGALDLLEERSEDAGALGGLGLLVNRLDSGIVGLDLLSGSSDSLSRGGFSLELLASLGDVLGDDRSLGGRGGDWGNGRSDNRSLLLDLRCLGGLALGLVLLLLLLSLVLLSKQSAEDGCALSRDGTGLGLLCLLLIRGAAGSRSGAGRSSDNSLLSSGDLSLRGLGGSVSALLGRGSGSSR